MFEEEYGHKLDAEGLEGVFAVVDLRKMERADAEASRWELTPEQENDELTKEFELHSLATRLEWEEMVTYLKGHFED